MAVPAAALLELNVRLPLKVDAPLVDIAPPLESEKSWTLATVPSVKFDALPALLRVTLFVGPAANVPANEVTALELARFVVTISAGVESEEVTLRVVALSEPLPVSLIAKAEPLPS